MSRDYYLNQLGIQQWQLCTQSSDECAEEPLIIPIEETSFSINDMDWDTLRQAVADCRKCQLCEGRTQTVFGVGDRQAKLMVVGEAPGYHEDQQGEPFVGRAGQLLTAILHAFHLQREQIYIANVLKCRPPNNRDPAIEEVVKCTPYLERQVELLNPNLIIAVGRYAAHFLLETNISLSRLRGKIHQFRQTTIPLIVSYHPAYLLRNPADKRKAFEDWRLALSILKK